jgi:hypothetical protein
LPDTGSEERSSMTSLYVKRDWKKEFAKKQKFLKIVQPVAKDN